MNRHCHLSHLITSDKWQQEDTTWDCLSLLMATRSPKTSNDPSKHCHFLSFLLISQEDVFLKQQEATKNPKRQMTLPSHQHFFLFLLISSYFFLFLIILAYLISKHPPCNQKRQEETRRDKKRLEETTRRLKTLQVIIISSHFGYLTTTHLLETTCGN